MRMPMFLIALFALPALMVLASGHTGPADDLSGKAVAILITEGFHDGETTVPRDYLLERGAAVTVIGPETGTFTAYNSDVTVEVVKSVDEVSAADFDALIIPGGQAPAALREIPEAVELTADFYRRGKIIAGICHGPQVMITAGILDGKEATGIGGIREELIECGAAYSDVPVVRDGNLITSRVPGDLPEFNRAIADALLDLDPEAEEAPENYPDAEKAGGC